ncbi:nickel pincer cofactor biosynthesis protein LarB [Myxococcota bacterium]|nr:nickel pincer cofactor biosynthesis protein LarB [Myxococcota bacterium]
MADIEALLEAVAAGALSVEAATAQLKGIAALRYARLDLDREARTGAPEVIYGAGKPIDALIEIIARMAADQAPLILATRVNAAKARRVLAANPAPGLRYDAEARALYRGGLTARPLGDLLVLSAGTSDAPVAAEAALTARLLGHPVERVEDVGVAGLHRLLDQLPRLRRARAVIVVAGMEGALPSVVAGLIKAPVIAVPTSVGYGAHLGGVTPLLAMLSGCAAGVSVVNIDNGFGAAMVAARMNQRPEPTGVDRPSLDASARRASGAH